MADLKQVAAVFAGGGIGSLTRFFLGNFIKNNFQWHFPASTFVVNIIACFILGCLVGFGEQRNLLSVELKLFLTVGFCGGFSTFSAFSLESVQLLQTGHYATFSAYIVFSVLLCIGSTAGGLSLSAYMGSPVQ